MQEGLNFGIAIEVLKAGGSITRKGWNAHHKLTLQVPDEHSKMTYSYIYMTTAQGDILPWVASQTDMLATDWTIES